MQSGRVKEEEEKKLQLVSLASRLFHEVEKVFPVYYLLNPWYILLIFLSLSLEEIALEVP